MEKFTVKELGRLLGIKKTIGTMTTKEVTSAQTALALVRSGVEFTSPEGRRLRSLAEDLRDRAIQLRKLTLLKKGYQYENPVAGEIKNTLSWKNRELD